MAFTVQDFNDLVRLLDEHPQWQAELRRVLLADDFLALPQIVRDLAEAQRRTEARVEELAEAQRRTEARVEELAEAQRRTEARVEELAEAQRRTEARVEELAEAQRRTEARVEQLAARMDQLAARMDQLAARMEELAEAQQRTEQHLAALADHQKQMQTDLGKMRTDLGTLRGDWLEWRYVSRAPAYFGSWLRRVRVMLPASLDPAVEDVLEAKLTPDELLEILRLDALIQGRLRRPEQAAEEVWLAVEISAVIDQGDVERALRRAALLRKAGFPAIPVVAGESLTQGATEAVRDAPVAVLLDGKTMGWETALQGDA